MSSSRFVVPAEATSWVVVRPDSDFPIQNLPFGQCSMPGKVDSLVVAIGDFAVHLVTLQEGGLLSPDLLLESFLDITAEDLSELRKELFDLLSADNPDLRDNKAVRKRALIPLSEIQLEAPIHPTSFVDFYAGIHHAKNVGTMFRPDQNPLLPNYTWLPIGYNGRASSVVASGTPIIRPKCQTRGPNDEVPAFGPTKELDFELEMGFYLSHGQESGKRITTTAAEDYILGLVIVNDWSARDTQRWEYQPLGPFLSKSFATTVSPWLVTLDALEPFRCIGMSQDPAPLPHLRNHGKPHFDITLEVWLQTKSMKSPEIICNSSTVNLYWSMAQQLAHQTSNGTPVEFGDLYATGTISGDKEGTFGSMLELSWRGQKPISLNGGTESRTFLEDGDTVIMKAYAQGDGFRVGFGEARGTVKAALP